MTNHEGSPASVVRPDSEPLRRSLAELVAAMERYEADAEGDAPLMHVEMMQRAKAVLRGAPALERPTQQQEKVWDDPKGIAQTEMLRGLAALRVAKARQNRAAMPGMLAAVLEDCNVCDDPHALAEQITERLDVWPRNLADPDLPSGAKPEPPAEPIQNETAKLRKENERLRAMARFVDSHLCPDCVNRIAMASFEFDREMRMSLRGGAVGLGHPEEAPEPPWDLATWQDDLDAALRLLGRMQEKLAVNHQGSTP